MTISTKNQLLQPSAGGNAEFANQAIALGADQVAGFGS
jgi:hypothetical protein